MWDDLQRVAWERLTHAYGRGRGVPEILLRMVSWSEQERSSGWSDFWGAVNHQGDYYDSTVAAIPFLVEAAGRPDVPDRARLLDYFRTRREQAPDYGGDPALDEPPGGVDVPTPLRTDAELAAAAEQDDEPDEDDGEEFDISSYRRMDLCAWQVGRAIQAARPTFEALLDDPDRAVAAASAELLLLWPETRAAAKAALIRTIEEEDDPVEQGRRILEFGVFGAEGDVAAYRRWVEPGRPPEMRSAAALAWAWVANPRPLPQPAAAALEEASAADCDAFARLPWEGVWHRGPWILPTNAATLILRLVAHPHDELRWRAFQGLAPGRATAKHLAERQVVPVLVRGLSDSHERVRDAAALALSMRGEAVLAVEPAVVPALLRTLDDSEPTACGQSARLLVILAPRLDPARRSAALAGIQRAARRFAGKTGAPVWFDTMGIEAARFLKEQAQRLRSPERWDLHTLFAESAFDRQNLLPDPAECDRRLAEAYAATPRETIAAAIAIAGDPGHRNAAIGAARWLATLGPAAEAALPALDATAEGPLDDFARYQIRSSGDVIRRSLLVDPEPGDEPSARGRIVALARVSKENAAAGADLVPELVDFLAHPDPFARAGAADLIAELAPDVPRVAVAVPALERLLDDGDGAEVGIAGRFEFEGRLYHWRRERRCPRAGAIRALFAIGRVPDGDGMLRALLAESSHAAIACGARVVGPHRFPIAIWRAAVDAAGGLAIADPLIRATRQQCRARAWSGEDDGSGFACESELKEVIRQLSGRLVWSNDQ